MTRRDERVCEVGRRRIPKLPFIYAALAASTQQRSYRTVPPISKSVLTILSLAIVTVIFNFILNKFLSYFWELKFILLSFSLLMTSFFFCKLIGLV